MTKDMINNKEKARPAQQYQQQEQHKNNSLHQHARQNRQHCYNKSPGVVMLPITMLYCLAVFIHGYIPHASSPLKSTRNSIPTINKRQQPSFLEFIPATTGYSSSSLQQPLFGYRSNNNNNNNNNENDKESKTRGKTKAKRRAPPNKKISIRWIIESVGKRLQEEEEQVHENDENGTMMMTTTTKTTTKVQKKTNEFHEKKKEDQLMNVLWKLYNAKNTRQVTSAGSMLESIYTSYSFDIQERLIKITSLVGLSQLSCQILQSMLSPPTDSISTTEQLEQQQLPYIPSSQSYISLLNTLRKRKMVNQMKVILHSLSRACDVVNLHYNLTTATDNQQQEDEKHVGEREKKSTPVRVHIIAINTYIAVLCDAALYNSGTTTSNSKSASTDHGNDVDYLAEAASHVLISPPSYETTKGTDDNDDDTTKNQCQKHPYLSTYNRPDLHSYNTILHAAAKLQNVELFQNVYSQLTKDENVQPDIYTYNARLKLCNNAVDATLLKGDSNDDEAGKMTGKDIKEEKTKRALEIIEELQSNPNVSPDRYTIDLALVPLVKAGYVGKILRLLENYLLQDLGVATSLTSSSSSTKTMTSGSVPLNDDNSTTTAASSATRKKAPIGWNKGQSSDAFASFLNTLVKANEIEMAQIIFDTFMLPPLSSSSKKQSNIDESSSDKDEKVLSEVTRAKLDQKKSGLKSSSSSSVTIEPSSRHFNILIDGYKRLASSNKMRRMNTAAASKQESKEEEEEEEKEGVNDETSFFRRKKIIAISKAKHQAMDLFLTMLHLRIRPDSYTISSIIGLLTTPDEISTVYRVARRFVLQYDLNPIVYRSIMTAYGKVEDPSSAVWLLDEMEKRVSTMGMMEDKYSTGKLERLDNWNVLLTALSKGNAFHSKKVLNVSNSNVALSLQRNDALNNNIDNDVYYEGEEEYEGETTQSLGVIGKLLDGKTCAEAAAVVLDLMTTDLEQVKFTSDSEDPFPLHLSSPPKPDTQSYTLVASTFSHEDDFTANSKGGRSIAMELYRNATSNGIPADGRFINAIIRCFGDDISGAIKAWKDELGRAVRLHENRPRRQRKRKGGKNSRVQGKNLIACYHGLMHVCGRAGKPDVALRLVYAMNKEGIEPTENALKCYESGKRVLERTIKEVDEGKEKRGIDPLGVIAKQKVRMANQYETLLVVECTKYDVEDKRRLGDKRVRIIF